MNRQAVDVAERRRLVRRLQRLAKYRPALERGMPFGEWAGGELPDGSIEMPWYAFSADADRFLDDIRTAGWVTPFDWPAWLSSRRGQRLMSDPEAVARASPDDLGHLLTALIRQERFADGTLAAAHDSGLLAAIARRAEVLAAALDRDETIGTWDARPWGRPWSDDQTLMDAAAKITEIGLARSPCYGTCPVYSLTLRRDGKAVFVGEHFVDMLGEHNARFDSSDFGTLALAVAQLRFGNLRRHYQVDYTDMPTTMTWLIQSARRRTVEDYGDAGPRRLRQIEGLIDDAAADLTWDVVVALNADSGGCGHIGDAGGDSWLPDPEPHEHPHWTQMRNASERW